MSKPTNVLVLGAAGQLGADLVGELARQPKRYSCTALDLPELDLHDGAAVKATFVRLRPELVINTAAYNAVDQAEREPAAAFETNALAVYSIAQACREIDATLVHFSTDFVFGGERRQPYTEDDLPAPLSVYAASKLAGEYMVRSALSKYFLVRTCGLYGVVGVGRPIGNFVEKMLRAAEAGKPLRVVDDQIVGPTASHDLALKVLELAATRAFGLYHVTNSGQCSWFEFAQQIFALAGLRPDLAPTNSATFSAPARRPAYSVLDNARLRATSLAPMRPWQQALADYLKARQARAGT